jgi:chromosome segregation ATPase
MIIAIASVAAILIAGYFVYCLANIATDLYQLKVEMKRNMEERIADLLKQVEVRIVDRSKWIRENLREENQRSLGELRNALEDANRDGDERIAELRQQFAAFEERLSAMERRLEETATTPAKTAKSAPAPQPQSEPDPGNIEYIGDAADPGETPPIVAALETPPRRKAKG